MATAYDCKFIETSVGICHNVDELLVGLLTQIRLKLENPEKSRFVSHNTHKHTHSHSDARTHDFTTIYTLCVRAYFISSYFLFNVPLILLLLLHTVCDKFMVYILVKRDAKHREREKAHIYTCDFFWFGIVSAAAA